jgi:benzoyl-CoA reductase/2-hydroxyglutaryl-CoA dehydratase subunit BcrC/BadD/HgdB
LRFFRAELGSFQKHLEQFTGKQLTEQLLTEAIEHHNRNRALVREIYELRKLDPSRLPASVMTRILIVSQSMPVHESNHLLLQIARELKEGQDGPPGGGPRIMVVGSEIDDSPIFELVESAGASVVIDDVCIGTRVYWADVNTEGDPLDCLAARYLERVMCPRTVREGAGSREEELISRFGHIVALAREFNVEGVILYVLRYCDGYAFDAPDLRDYLEAADLKVLHIEDDYAVAGGKLRTRIEAFIEMLT